jgi:hypothetical protein
MTSIEPRRRHMSEDFMPGEQAPDEEPLEERGDGRRRWRTRGSTWTGGAVLILIGVVFLVRNITGIYWGNWWAVFILIPAVTSLANAWSAYQRRDRKSLAAARGSLFGGLAMLTVALVFFFNLDWGRIWPVFIIIGGLAALVSGVLD